MLHQHKIMTVFSIAMETLETSSDSPAAGLSYFNTAQHLRWEYLARFCFVVLLEACTSPSCARFGGPPSGGPPKRTQPGEVWALDPPYLLFLWDSFGGIPGVEHVHVTPQLFKTDTSSSDP